MNLRTTLSFGVLWGTSVAIAACGGSSSTGTGEGGIVQSGGSGGGSGSGGGAGSGTGGGAGSGTGGASGSGTGGSAGVAGAGGIGGNCSNFPTFITGCTNSQSCVIGFHMVSCCGTRAALGINHASRDAFDTAEAACEATYPACGCAQSPTTTDTGETALDESTIKVECRGGTCTTFVNN